MTAFILLQPEPDEHDRDVRIFGCFHRGCKPKRGVAPRVVTSKRGPGNVDASALERLLISLFFPRCP